MDYIDPFGDFQDFEDSLPPARASFGRNGVLIKDLEEGADFEFDPHAYPLPEETENGFNQEEVIKYLNPDCIQTPIEEDDLTTPFSHMEAQMEDISGGKGKVFKRILRTGVGQSIPDGATVRVHYNGYLEYSDEPYDSTRLRNKPLTIRLGNGQVIPGLELGVASMRKSELARILVKPDFAFGKMGCPPRIPPEATILYEVEVLSFIDHKAADTYQEMTEDEKVKVTLKELVDVANAEKEAGNDFFEQKMFGKATQRYLKAINMLEPSRLKNGEEEKMWADSLIKLYLNLSLCNLKQKKPKPVITNCRRVLELDEKNVKATFRLGKAFSLLGEWEEAKKYMLRAIHLAPNNTELRQELAALDRKMKEFQTIEKGIYSRMFQSDEAKMTQATNDKLNISNQLRELFKEKLESFHSNDNMHELVLPIGTSAEEIQCIEDIACELGGLETVRGDQRSQFSLKIIKPDMFIKPPDGKPYLGEESEEKDESGEDEF